MIEIQEEILLYAFRYALGRQSYSPYDVAPLLIKNKDKLNKYNKMVIVREIEWFLESVQNHPKDLIELWENVKLQLQEDENV